MQKISREENVEKKLRKGKFCEVLQAFYWKKLGKLNVAQGSID